MTLQPPQSDTTSAVPCRRTILYLLADRSGRTPDFVTRALVALRPHADRLIIVDRSSVASPIEALASLSDSLIDAHGAGSAAAAYRIALASLGELRDVDELVLTGDSWFGPVRDLEPVLDRMAAEDVDLWGMVENIDGPPEDFPEQGFPREDVAWTWVAARSALLVSREWNDYWHETAIHDATESGLFAHFAAIARRVSFGFRAVDYPSSNPAVFTPDLLLDDGCPTLDRRLFGRFPPFLDRHAVIGRQLLEDVDRWGYPIEFILADLSRTVPPKAMNTTLGMVEVLPDVATSMPSGSRPRIAVLAHITDLDSADLLLSHLSNLPAPWDLVVTTRDGMHAGRIQALVERRADPGMGLFEVRVTQTNRGRDMSDFFVGCRDILLAGGYDLIVKVHARPSKRKTMTLRRYVQRYQYENLLNSPGYAQNVVALFDREPGLGVVFPPMPHIGYSIMGRGWAFLRVRAEELCEALGISVPFDRVSPLAPFGGMWIGRPEAFRILAERRWAYRDYGRRHREYGGDLAKIQERLVAYAAGQDGYHCRNVLTAEHASISYTALEFKLDEMLSTTRGFPVEQIQFLQRAGWTGFGGAVGLSRMYLRLSHPRAARVLEPVYHVASRFAYGLKDLRGLIGRRRDRSGLEDDE